jgi:hypothetical protein
MIDHPFETKSDSFYFVNDRLIMHNKASYKVCAEKDMSLALSTDASPCGAVLVVRGCAGSAVTLTAPFSEKLCGSYRSKPSFLLSPCCIQYIREGAADAKKSYEDKFGAKVRFSVISLSFFFSPPPPPLHRGRFSYYRCSCKRIGVSFGALTLTFLAYVLKLPHPSLCTQSFHPQGAKSASAKAASKIAGEDEDSAEADAKAIADAKETSRGGAAAAKVCICRVVRARLLVLSSLPLLLRLLCTHSYDRV